MLNGFGTIVNSLGKRVKPYLPQICGTILWRLNNKSAKVRQQAADLISRIAVVMKTCQVIFYFVISCNYLEFRYHITSTLSYFMIFFCFWSCSCMSSIKAREEILGWIPGWIPSWLDFQATEKIFILLSSGIGAYEDIGTCLYLILANEDIFWLSGKFSLKSDKISKATGH